VYKAYIIYAWASIIPSLRMGGGGGVGQGGLTIKDTL
jgi:hypothetical protein